MKNLVLTDKNLYARMDETKWSFEASGMYRSYLSIAEKRSVRSIKAMFASLHTFVISGIRHA